MIVRITSGAAILRIFDGLWGLCNWSLFWIGLADRGWLGNSRSPLDTSFCLEALERAFQAATPAIFNTDQAGQFTSQESSERLKAANVRISWDGRGRAWDTIFVERLWRSVKYEEVFSKDYRTVLDARNGLQAYFQFYHHERLHQALDYHTPAQVYLR